jgi:hypothetical protein
MMQLTTLDVILWAFGGLVEALTLYLVFYLWAAPKIKIWKIYIGYDLVASSYMLVISVAGMYNSPLYAMSWWAMQMIGYILLAFLCIELLTVIIPRYNRLVVVYGIAIGVILVSMVSRGMPPYRTSDLMPISFNCVRLCSFLLLIGVALKRNWEWPYPGIAAGIMLKMLNMLAWGHLWQYSANHGWKYFLEIRYLYELVAILTMLVWGVCAWWPVRPPWVPFDEFMRRLDQKKT